MLLAYKALQGKIRISVGPVLDRYWVPIVSGLLFRQKCLVEPFWSSLFNAKRECFDSMDKLLKCDHSNESY